MSPEEIAERALGHPVPLAVMDDDGARVVAASVAGDPPRTRLAWVAAASGEVVARVACPPGRPSRFRPVVATAVTLADRDRPDRVLAARVAPGIAAVRPLLAIEDPLPDVPVSGEGLAVTRIPREAAVIAVDALERSGEPVGRLLGAGVADLRIEEGTVGGRLGLSHGMAAGIGPGRWVPGLAEAAFEAGYDLWLPEWLPEGVDFREPRLEADAAYPAAPPAVVLTWTGPQDARVLLRQAPAPLASPDPGGRTVREVDVAGVPAVLRGRWLVTLVWETRERAFGLQVRRVPDPETAALRVARSVAPVAARP
jgi:hypothetical protein